MIEIKDDWCKGCGICIDRCPLKVLEESQKINRRGVHPPQLIANDNCNYCRLCELLCPDLAIVVRPDKDIKEDLKKQQKTVVLIPVGGKRK